VCLRLSVCLRLLCVSATVCVCLRLCVCSNMSRPRLADATVGCVNYRLGCFCFAWGLTALTYMLALTTLTDWAPQQQTSTTAVVNSSPASVPASKHRGGGKGKVVVVEDDLPMVHFCMQCSPRAQRVFVNLATLHISPVALRLDQVGSILSMVIVLCALLFDSLLFVPVLSCTLPLL
jgi:hypothetical protein